jgi:prepilin-type N-terminal cleavage/methylation domain-containing protein
MKTKGFTLIELLVVIAIIAVLMGILMPALSKVKKQARSAACMSQLKQWGLVWSMYTDGADGKFPSGKIRGGQNLGRDMPRGAWITALRAGWEKHPELLLCPSAFRRNDGTSHGNFDMSYTMAEYKELVGGALADNDEASYGMNNWAYSVTSALQGRAERSHWKTVFKIKQPNEVPLFLDSMWRGGGPQWESTNDISPPSFNGDWQGAGHEMKHFAIDRHARGINSLFMDSTVRKVRIKELWDLKWHRDYDVRRAQTMSPSWWGPWLGKEQG